MQKFSIGKMINNYLKFWFISKKYMLKSAQYILSSYSFIYTSPLEKLLQVGYQTKNGNLIPSFDEKLLVDLCSEAQETLMNESNILDINDDVIIVGDIHGNFHDLLRILKFVQLNDQKVLFLGNYVNHGNFSLECMTLLFALKVMYPNKFYLIRGSHEFDSMCSQYGFKDEICNSHSSKKTIRTNNNENDPSQINQYDEYYSNCKNLNFYKYTSKLYHAFIKTFSYLPIGAIVNKTTFCVHGGLSPLFTKIDSLNTMIDRPIYNFEDNQLLSDLLWSEPFHNVHYLFDKKASGRGNFFNRECVSNFLNENSLNRIIRSNQYSQNGLIKSFDDQCITVFSSSAFDKKYQDNCSSVLQLFQNDDTIQITTFPPIKRLEKSEAVYYKVEPLNTNLKKIPFCFSFVQPNLHYTTIKKINPMKSENRLKSSLNTKFVTNPRRSSQIVKKTIIRDSISIGVLNSNLNES